MSNTNPKSFFPIGCYGTHNESYDQFFPLGSTSKLIILSVDRHHSSLLLTTATIKKILDKSPIPPHPYLADTNLFDLIQQQAVGAIAIMTDGCFNSSQELNQKGGSIIFKHSNSLYTCIFIEVDIQCTSVFPIELCALAFAQISSVKAQAQCRIYSDSQAAINVMQNIQNESYQKNLLTYALNQKQIYGEKPTVWVHSHIEQRCKDMNLWTDAEVGNYIADKTAGYKWENSTEITLNLPHPITIRKTMSIPISKVIQSINQYASINLSKDSLYYYDDIMNTKIEQITNNYLIERDNYRSIRLNNPSTFWTNKVTQVLPWTNRTPASILQLAFRTRIIYNKHWTTGNQFRYRRTSMSNVLSWLRNPTAHHI